MKKKIVFSLLPIVTLNFFYLVAAQQPAKVYRIGFLSGSSSAVAPVGPLLLAMRELGYFEGKNIVVEDRFSEGEDDRLPDLAMDLVRKRVDVIVAVTTAAAKAAKKTTATIPIVITFVGDPVGSGIVDNLARPGGNITGVATRSPELSGKRLELLKEAFPRVSLVAMLWNPSNSANELSLRETELAARGLRVQLQPLEVQRPKDFDEAFSAITKTRAGALLLLRDPILTIHEPRIIDFAAKNRLPAMYSRSGSAEAGGLMFYGQNDSDFWRRTVIYVDKILKGVKPADLPVEQPMKIEFALNLKTAKQIGLTIPESVLYRVDRVIK